MLLESSVSNCSTGGRTSGDLVKRQKLFGYPKQRKRFLTSISPYAGGEAWGVHDNSVSNLERAIVERVFTVGGKLPPVPTRLGQLGNFDRLFHNELQPVPTMTTEQFVDTYVGRKKRTYELAAASLEVSPIQLKDAYIQAFIKDEKTNLTRKDDPCPRIIQPRSARFNLEIGKYLKPLEKPAFKAVNAVWKGVTVFKGLNAVQRARELRKKWDSFDNPVAVLLDAKRFDQHTHRKMRDREDRNWLRAYQGDAHLKRLLGMRKVNKVFARAHDGAITYVVNGKRMSGDMDTAMGNCYTMCAMTWTFLNMVKVNGMYANDGDDGVLIVEREDVQSILDQYEDIFLGWGYTMVLEGIAYEFEHIEFCQARPVYNGEIWTMVRDPIICMGKDSLVIGVKPIRETANAIGWCGLSLAGDMPIFSALYRHFINDSQPGEIEYTTGMQFLARGLDPRDGRVNDVTRLSFYKAFGILPDDQITFEDEIRKLDEISDNVILMKARIRTILPTQKKTNKLKHDTKED